MQRTKLKHDASAAPTAVQVALYCLRVARARREARAWRGTSTAGLGLAIGRTPAYGLRVF